MFCFFFKQKTAYEMRISDWSSDVCSSDLLAEEGDGAEQGEDRDEIRVDHRAGDPEPGNTRIPEQVAKRAGDEGREQVAGDNAWRNASPVDVADAEAERRRQIGRAHV